MYKAFIATITVAALSSVAYCQGQRCDNKTLKSCNDFCTITSRAEGITTMCEGTGESFYCYVTKGAACGVDIDKTCQVNFNSKSKISCICWGGQAEGCVVRDY